MPCIPGNRNSQTNVKARVFCFQNLMSLLFLKIVFSNRNFLFHHKIFSKLQNGLHFFYSRQVFANIKLLKCIQTSVHFRECEGVELRIGWHFRLCCNFCFNHNNSARKSFSGQRTFYGEVVLPFLLLSNKAFHVTSSKRRSFQKQKKNALWR